MGRPELRSRYGRQSPRGGAADRQYQERSNHGHNRRDQDAATPEERPGSGPYVVFLGGGGCIGSRTGQKSCPMTAGRRHRWLTDMNRPAGVILRTTNGRRDARQREDEPASAHEPLTHPHNRSNGGSDRAPEQGDKRTDATRAAPPAERRTKDKRIRRVSRADGRRRPQIGQRRHDPARPWSQQRTRVSPRTKTQPHGPTTEGALGALTPNAHEPTRIHPGGEGRAREGGGGAAYKETPGHGHKRQGTTTRTARTEPRGRDRRARPTTPMMGPPPPG